MTANKTSFNSQNAAIAQQKGVESRRRNKLLRDAYLPAFMDKADELVKAFVGGSNEMLGIKIPLEVRARIMEQVIAQTVTAALTTAIKQRSDVDMLLAKADAKALETMPPESDDGEYMTTTQLMEREGTQSEAASASEIEEDEEKFVDEDGIQIFGDWYNELSEQDKNDVMSEYFHNSLDELFNYYTKPKDEVIKRFKIKIGV
ncbi:hypothetical protein [Aeromonas hydrophila]|uniref:hypothetical protein n=1 Tax=Aeromonas hydrophila TaxID=644 RepID=UPI000C339821|nr:hypothetical protein [Aeromonas hydrophila]